MSAPNALHALRARLEVSVHELARRLGIPMADVDTLEHTRFDLLEVGDVERACGALGCRLDVVAQHIDGEAIWLSGDDQQHRWPPAAAHVGELCRTGLLHMQDRAGRLWAVFPDGHGLTPDAAARLHQEGEAVACGFHQVVDDGELWTVLDLRTNGELDAGQLARAFGGTGNTRAAEVRLCQSDPIGAVRALLGAAPLEEL